MYESITIDIKSCFIMEKDYIYTQPLFVHQNWYSTTSIYYAAASLSITNKAQKIEESLKTFGYFFLPPFPFLGLFFFLFFAFPLLLALVSNSTAADSSALLSSPSRLMPSLSEQTLMPSSSLPK